MADRQTKQQFLDSCREKCYDNRASVNGRPSYSTIWGYAYSEACLIHHAGQCVQYNGALDELLCYMGYNAYMIHTSRPHFRAEVEIDGYIFGMEVGETEYDSPEYDFFDNLFL